MKERQNLSRYTEDIGEIGGKYRATRTFPATQQSTSGRKLPVTAADSKSLGENFCSRFIVATHERASNVAYHRAQLWTLLLHGKYFRETRERFKSSSGLRHLPRSSKPMESSVVLFSNSANSMKFHSTFPNVFSRFQTFTVVECFLGIRSRHRDSKETHNSRIKHSTRKKSPNRFPLRLNKAIRFSRNNVQRQRIIGLFLALASNDCLSASQLIVGSSDFRSCRLASLTKHRFHGSDIAAWNCLPLLREMFIASLAKRYRIILCPRSLWITRYFRTFGNHSGSREMQFFPGLMEFVALFRMQLKIAKGIYEWKNFGFRAL